MMIIIKKLIKYYIDATKIEGEVVKIKYYLI